MKYTDCGMGNTSWKRSLEIEFAMQEEADIATYSECGETVEQMEIPDMAPEERKRYSGKGIPIFWYSGSKIYY